MFQVNCRREGETTVLALSGEADLSTVEVLGEAVASATASGRMVVVDCAGLTFIDCTTLGLLLHGQDRATGHGGDLVLRNCRGIVDQVLGTLHLHGRLIRPASLAAAGDRDRSVVVTPAPRPRSMLW